MQTVGSAWFVSKVSLMTPVPLFHACRSQSDHHRDVVSDVEMECLATWKMHAELFIVGRLHGAGFSRAEQQYRCLVSYTPLISRRTIYALQLV